MLLERGLYQAEHEIKNALPCYVHFSKVWYVQVECFGPFLALIFGTFGEKWKVFKHSHCILFFWCFMNWPEPHSMSSYFVNTLQGMFEQAFQFSKSHYDGVMVYRRCRHSTEFSKYFFHLPLYDWRAFVCCDCCWGQELNPERSVLIHQSGRMGEQCMN